MNKKTIIQLLLIVIISVAVSGYKSILPQTDQDKTSTKTIGIARWISSQEFDRNIEGFKAGLAENGYVEGKNINFIIKNPEADNAKQREIIQSFNDTDVDLIYSLTTTGTLIAKEMVKDKPIVFSIVSFPVEAGIIDMLESSGNNLVGTRTYISLARQYNQFERIYLNTKTLAFVHRKGELNSDIQYNEMKELLNMNSKVVMDIAAVDLEDIRAQLNNKANIIDSTYSACDSLIQSGGEEIVIEFGKAYKKPGFTCNKAGVKNGTLMGNVVDFYDMGKKSGRQAALILGGSNPSSLLTESPAEDYLIINTKTAAEIGIVIPRYVLDDAEEIVTE